MIDKNNSYTFHKLALKHSISEAIVCVYGLNNIEVRVVRQSRVIGVGNLQHLDYAVPCFELALAVDVSVETVTRALVKELQRNADILKRNNLSSCKFEAIAGYINFQLDNEYLINALAAPANWIQSNRTPSNKKIGDVFLIAGWEARKLKNSNISDEAYQYIQNVYRALDINCEVHYLLSDFSETMQASLSTSKYKLNKKERKDTSNLSSQKLVRSYLTNPSGFSRRHLLRKLFLAEHEISKIERKKVLKELNIKNYKLIYESSIIDNTHKHIDRLHALSDKEGRVIKDEASKAAYYAIGDYPTPLRSAKGMLYSTAFLLYVLEDLLRASERKHIRKLIIILPTELHTLIKHYINLLKTKEYISTEVVLFDPSVSRADILQLESTLGSIEDHFKGITRLLKRTAPVLLDNAKRRQEILSFIDMPNEMNDIITNSQLPALFDLLDSSITTLTNFET